MHVFTHTKKTNPNFNQLEGLFYVLLAIALFSLQQIITLKIRISEFVVRENMW